MATEAIFERIYTIEEFMRPNSMVKMSSPASRCLSAPYSRVTSNSRTEMKLGEDELRQVTLYAAACARRVLPVFEASRPDDHRPREAIVEAEAFGAGKRRTATLRASA